MYTKISYWLSSFYEICYTRDEIHEKVKEIGDGESRLLGNLLEFLKTGWKHIRRKRSLVRQCKKDMAETLEKVSQYLSNQSLLERKRRDFKRFVFNQDTLHGDFVELLDNITFDFYTEPYFSLDTDSVMRVVDHVRSEIEAYSLNTSTLFSALIGAIVGSIITLVISCFL